jgi:hypothetical protein
MSTTQKPVSAEDYKLYIRELKKRNLGHQQRIKDLQSDLLLHQKENESLKTQLLTLNTTHQ